MESVGPVLTMYVITLPMAVLAFRYALRMLRLREPPAGPMRSLQLGRPVTDPAEKLALAHQIGWGWMVFSLAMIVGPVLTALNKTPAEQSGEMKPAVESRR